MGLTVQASSTQWVTGSFPLKIRNKSYYIGPKALMKIKAFTPHPLVRSIWVAHCWGYAKSRLANGAIAGSLIGAGVVVQLASGDKRSASGSGPFLGKEC